MANLQKEKPELPSATIVIPTYQRTNLALKLAKQIRSFHQDIQIIIVEQENPSTKEEKEIVKYRVEYYQLAKANTSVAKNLGIAKAKGEIIIFFDDDVEITKNTINNHLKQYANNKIIGVAGRVINDNDVIPKNTNVKTGSTNWLGTKFNYQFWSTKKQTVDFVYGCNMSFRKSILDQIDGFDKNFSKVFEEVDLSHRIKKHGDIIFEPEALVYHHKAPSGGIRSQEKQNKNKLIFENYGHYLAKNVLFPFSLITLFLRTVTALKISISTVGALHKGYFRNITFQLINLLRQNIWTVLIFGIILFVRLYQVPELFNFTFSEENQAHMAWEQVKNFHPIWIGVSAANINYYLGPGFTYLNYILFLLSKGDPIILAYFSSFFGLITSISVYYVVRTTINHKAAVFSTIIYGCSTLLNFHDRRFWNATLIPFITIWMIYSLIQAKKNTRWYILTAILIGAFYHIHLSLLLLLAPTLYSVITNFKKIKITTWILTAVCYLLITSPLLVFDFVHNFDNLLMPIRTLLGKQKVDLYHFSISNIISHLQELQSTLGRLWFITINSNPQDQIVLESHYGKTTGSIALSIISLIALIYFFIRYRQRGYQILSISLIVNLLAFIIYPSYNPEYYLMSFLLLMTIAIGYWLSHLPSRLAIFITTAFIFVNVISTMTMSAKYGLLEKKQLIIKTIKVIKDQTFRLETYGELPNPHFAYAGWRYLFKAYGKTPASSNIDQVLGYLYPDELNKAIPQLKVIVVDTIKPSFTDKPLVVINQGVYSAYVFKN